MDVEDSLRFAHYRWPLARPLGGGRFRGARDRDNDPLELYNLWNEPEYHADRARLVEAMLKEQYRYADLMPRPVYMG